MAAFRVVLVALACLGHAALWVGVVNRWHAIGFRRSLVKSITLLFYLALLVLPLAVLLQLKHMPSGSAGDGAGWADRVNWATVYFGFCVAYGLVRVPIWMAQRVRAFRLPAAVRRVDGCICNVARRLPASPAHGLWARSLSLLPLNQLWHLEVNQFELTLPRLPEPLEGFSICHLSDLHYSGRIDRSYFVEVVGLINQMRPDMIALTGDVCDARACFAWIPETIGKLEAPAGKFFVLGNHDLRTRAIDELRATIGQAGFVDVSQQCHQCEGGEMLVAGDERPWFPGGNAIEALDGGPLKVLLAHTPDRLKWARRQGFDLMLAGHTHGGQVRFPVIGPVVCPSWYGTRYAAGFFHKSPTLLHVSRGAAGMFPYRLNCRPEITKLVLRRSA